MGFARKTTISSEVDWNLLWVQRVTSCGGQEWYSEKQEIVSWGKHSSESHGTNSASNSEISQGIIY